jgi:hypothetical protein
MAYTTPLRSLPTPPDARARFTDEQGRPTKELFDWVNRATEWMKAAHAALEQLEP